MSQTLDSLLFQVFKNEELTLKVIHLLKDQSSFYKAFIRDNQKALFVMVAKALEIFKVHTSEEHLSSALSESLPIERETQESLHRLTSLVNVLIETFLSQSQAALKPLANIITPEMIAGYLTILALGFTEDSGTLDLRFEAFALRYERELRDLRALLQHMMSNIDVTSLVRLEKEINAEIAKFVARIQLEIKEEELRRIKDRNAKLLREIQELGGYLREESPHLCIFLSQTMPSP